MKIRNTFIIFLVSGFWHGANWTFIAWGFLNALYILPSIIFNTHRRHLDIVAKGQFLPTFKELLAMGMTFSLTVFAWIFFRSVSVTDALSYISSIFTHSLFAQPDFPGIHKAVFTLFLIGLFLIIEWLGRENQYAIARMGVRWNRPLRYAFYYTIIAAIFWFGGKEQVFIYFQF